MPKSRVTFALIITILFLSFNAKTVRSMTCEEAVTSLMPCQPYLTGPAAKPTASCCSAVDNVNRQATSTEARRDLCVCFEKAATSFRIDPDKSRVLPLLCGISVVVPIDPKLNCSSISS